MKDPKRFYTYAYLREDRTPYYVGKGEGRRAYSKRHRVSVPPLDRILFLKKNLTEKEAIRHEVYMIDVFGRKDIGTGILRNLTNGGEGISGFKHSNETKVKIANAGRNRTHTEETKNKLSKLHVGKKLTEKTKQKIKEKRKLQVITEEHKEKIRNSLKGRKRPQNVIEKIKKGRTGIKHTEQTKQIIKEKRANQIFTKDTRKKLSEAHIGKPKPHLCKQFQIINPEGKVIDGVGIKKFCKENNLSYGYIRKVLKGTQSHHKGWTKPVEEINK
jgi:hypothetical protein